VRRLTSLALMATATALAAAAGGGCASAGGPPGGPERKIPPQILSVTPESGEVNVKIKQVEFKFDEVVSDRPSGGTAAANLDQIFLVSPRDGAAEVGWHRDRITVKPRKGFRANTTYRITLLPGLTDLRGNSKKDGMSILFSTGTGFPPFSILGRVFDWEAQRPVTGAYVEAISQNDTTLAWIAATDTSGQFDVGPLPEGSYLLRALIDQNANRALDRNEKWDSTTVVVRGSRPFVELDAIERDTVPAAIANVTADDSVTLHVTFDKALDPSLPLQPALFRIVRADSSVVEITRVQWAAAYDRSKATADSARAAAADTTKRPPPPAVAPPVPGGVPVPGGPRTPPPPPKPKAPAPEKIIVLTVSPSTLLVPGRYVLTTRGLRNLVGRSSDLRRGFTIAPPRPPAPRDTTGAKPPARPPARTPR
jgi:hypothetical protein